MRPVIVCILAIILIFPVNAHAGSFEVAPTTLYLSPSARSSVFYIVNRGQQPVIAQVEAFDWQQPVVPDSKDNLVPSDRLMVSPPMVKLMPGQRQTVRLAVRTDTQATQEQGFRLVVSELQDPSYKSDQGVQVLLQFSVPVFVLSGHKTPMSIAWSIDKNSDGSYLLTAHNNATRHVKLSNISFTLQDGREIPLSNIVFNYLLAGATHQWRIVLPPETSGQILLLKARDETEGALEAPVTVPQ